MIQLNLDTNLNNFNNKFILSEWFQIINHIVEDSRIVKSVFSICGRMIELVVSNDIISVIRYNLKMCKQFLNFETNLTIESIGRFNFLQ